MLLYARSVHMHHAWPHMQQQHKQRRHSLGLQSAPVSHSTICCIHYIRRANTVAPTLACLPVCLPAHLPALMPGGLVWTACHIRSQLSVVSGHHCWMYLCPHRRCARDHTSIPGSCWCVCMSAIDREEHHGAACQVPSCSKQGLCLLGACCN